MNADVVVITGAGSGIGRALAVRTAELGASLVLWDRDGPALEATARGCRGSDPVVRVVDVTDEAAVTAAADDAVAVRGVPHLVLCAAGVIHTGSVSATDDADARHVVDVNLWGTVHVVRALLPHQLAAGRGHVVTFSSAFGAVAAPGYSAYCASKFAVRGFTEALRLELAVQRSPVRVTCVLPGGVRTPIVRTGTFARGTDRDAVVERFERRVARTSPEAAAEAVLRAVRRDRPTAPIGVDARFAWLAVRALGGAYQRIVPAAVRLASRR